MAVRGGGRGDASRGRAHTAARPLVSGRVAAVALLLVTGWWFLAPPALGGQTSYVATGTSMPDYPAGGLVLVRERAGYAVGDVVAHRAADGTPALGRVVAAADDRFLVRGDTSALAAPTRPSTEALLGTPWLHLPHAATLVAALTSPVGFGLSLLALMAVVLGLGTARQVGPVRRPVTPLRP
ncbi:hypothetical protein [Nocardioides coralli]|uniref:hypothetical protein n=1 Tax=Nocardioides coralli TaxID=2872154 RepID=UPI001CA436E7|nr:hypothetical protein [Nocardioides coralli]QZY28229.1 hypothetical protein K6T13_12145 [Nocardioides coralli]